MALFGDKHSWWFFGQKIAELGDFFCKPSGHPSTRHAAQPFLSEHSTWHFWSQNHWNVTEEKKLLDRSKPFREERQPDWGILLDGRSRRRHERGIVFEFCSLLLLQIHVNH